MANDSTLRYLKLDFQSHRDALLQRVRSRWPLVWNDFLNNSFGMVLVDLIAWSTATLAFVINRTAGEMFVGSMTLRESAVRLGENVGYQLRGPSPAVVACEATLTSAQSAPVTVVKGTLIRTADATALPFEAVKDYRIEAGSLTPKETVVSIAPGLSGPKTLAAYCRVTQASSNVDLTDSAIDLAQYVEVGQVFQVEGNATEYVIQGIETAPGALSNNRMVLSAAYAGTTATVAATVFDRRIQFVQGQTITDRFVSPVADTPNYAVKLSRVPVIENTAEVVVNGEPWTQVPTLAGLRSTDAGYVVQTFATGESVVQFGDNVFGAQIPTEALILVTYRVGGGQAGNVGLNTINTSITGLIQSLNSPVTVTIKNQTSAGQGGRDAETLEEARTMIPYYVRANDRAVTLDDYQTIAQTFSSAVSGSVAYARAAVRTENAVLEGNVVAIYAWTTGSGGGLVNLSAPLKQAVQEYVQSKAVGTDYVLILDGDAKPVPLSLRFKTFSGFSVVETKALVEDQIRSIVNALRPGQPLIYSDFVRKLDAVYGVDRVNMATPLSDLAPASTIELFTPPQADYTYALPRNGQGTQAWSAPDGYNIGLYRAQLPVFPVLAWSFRLFLGSNELTVVPGLKPGEALVLGSNLSVNPAYASTVNLLTGAVNLWLVGAPGDLTMKLVPVAGYSSERSVNVYVGYDGDNTQTTRREIRAALRAWSDNLAIGSTLYGVPVAGVLSSKSCVKEVVAGVTGVDAVHRVALDTPGNTADRIPALDYELLRIGNIIINNQLD